MFDILLVLLQNSGHLLTKTELMRLVWPLHEVEEGNLTRNVSTLRSALGETPREAQYIETIPWRGYRFVANVKKVRADALRGAIDSIAVLPFVNVNSDTSNEYLADGITETLITNLAQLTRLRIISRNSVFRYKGREVSAQTLGRELQVQAVLLGRVSQSDDLLSICVELVDTSDDRHLWGAQYIRSQAELFSAQETMAREIAGKLSAESEGDRERIFPSRHTENKEAYLLFMQGRYYFHKLTPEGVTKGADYFQQAIEKDPAYAVAYAALADCHNYLNQRNEAKQAVLKAVELDEKLGEAHATLGFYHFLYEWDFARAESEFAQAVALAPNYAEAHHWYGIFLANLGRHEEACREAELAVERDPLSLLMHMTAALNSYTGRQYERAVEQLHKVIDMEANFPAARSVLGCVYVQKQMYDEALAQFERALRLVAGAPLAEASVKVLMAQAYARAGKQDEARNILRMVRDQPVSPYAVAGVHAALAENEAAFQALDQAYEQRDMQLVSLKVDPTLDALRSDSRFPELVKRVGLPQ